MSPTSTDLFLKLLLAATLSLALGPPTDARERLDFRHTVVHLPGPPSTVVSADLDADGVRDLVVVVAYTEWDQLTIEESARMDGVEGLVEVMTVVPALADRRELRVYLGRPGGGFRPLDHVLPLTPELLALEPGYSPDADGRGVPVVAITDRGISALRFVDGRLSFEPLVERRPVLAGTGSFVPRLGLSHDFDGDGRADLFFPAAECGAVYLADGSSYASASECLELPTDRRRAGSRLARRYPLPEVRDVDGDRRPDLVFFDREDGPAYFVSRNLGGGRFGEPVGPLGSAPVEPCSEDERRSGECPSFDPGFGYFGDLDGDGRAEYVVQESLAAEDAGMRQEMRQAKRPPYRYRVFHSGEDLRPETEPFLTFDALGYTFGPSDDDGDDGITIPGGFQDLDGDGRKDLLALTLDFSIFQAVRIMATHTISIGLDFHIYCRQDDGSYRAVEGLDLSGKFKIDLDDVRLGRLSLFDGDFDGDGRADFVQLGRGRTVSIHRGADGCRYPSRPDLVLELEEEPRNLALVRIEDFDADGLSDLLIVQPNPIDEPGVTPPVRLDLYSSGRGEEER